MGAVWAADHTTLRVGCAVKLIHEDIAKHEEIRARFEREAQSAAQLKSPHVVQVLDYGVFEGVPYIAMELLEGHDLARRLEEKGRLSASETLTILSPVAKALAKAHGMGLVHRDLKPENVFLAKEEEGEIVKVLDFGIAKRTGVLEGNATKTGALLGTPYYMSPEQVQGTKAVDHRADLWSLGVIAYRCMVGRLPFESEAVGDLFLKIMVQPLPIPSAFAADLPAGFDAFWAKAAARSPDERFQSAKELVEALRGVAASSSDPAAAPKPWTGPGISQPGHVAGPGTPSPASPSPALPMASSALAFTPTAYASGPHGPGALPAQKASSLDGSVRGAPTLSGSPSNRAGLVAAVIIGGTLLLGAGAAAAFFALRADDSPPASSAAAAPAAPSVQAPETEPSVAAPPDLANTAAAPSASAALPLSQTPAGPTPAKPTSAAPPTPKTASPPPKPPPTQTAAPTRTGRVVIPPPG